MAMDIGLEIQVRERELHNLLDRAAALRQDLKYLELEIEKKRREIAEFKIALQRKRAGL